MARIPLANEKTYRCLFRLSELLPLPVRAALLEKITVCVWAADHERRRIARINLRIAFPDMEDSEAARITRLCYVRLGTSAAEFLHLPKMDSEYLRNHFSIEGLEHIRRSEKELGMGPLAITGHFGNWELLAYVYGSTVAPVAFVARTFQDKFVDQFITERRQLGGNKVIRKSDSAKEVIRTIRSGTMVGMLMDQSVKPSRGVLVDFFTQKAFTHSGFARLALSLRTNIHPAFIFRDPHRKFHHTLRFGPPIPMDPKAPREEEVVRVTRKCNEELERAIRQDPTHWIWFYRRWKAKGKGALDLYKQDRWRSQ